MSAAAHALPRGELVLDRYRPLRPLGSGGSGSVWLARDERNGLDVALKIIPREGKAAHRAEREAEAASRLRHERCLRAYGFGSDSGHVYIAYEYVGGRTLREAMRGGELRDGQAVEAAAQILDGLAHAHSRGIVHRDVKPSNVLLAEDDGISVRLLDFGLAQFDEAETLTAVGDVPGTLAYISPERLRGEEACSASDIWAVGVLLWEALAGKHPFWGVPLPQMAGTIEAGCPPLQPERPDLPKRLLSAISHALAHDPARRPPAAALAKELRSALAGGKRSPKVDRRLATGSRPAGGPGRGRRRRGARRRDGAAVLSDRLGGCARGGDRVHRVPGSACRSRARARRAGAAARQLRARAGGPLRRRSRSAGWRSRGESRAGGSPSSPGLFSPPSACSRSSRSSRPESPAPRAERPRRSPRSQSQRSSPACAESRFPSARGSRRRSDLEGVDSAVTAARVADRRRARRSGARGARARRGRRRAALRPDAVAARRSRRGDARGHAPGSLRPLLRSPSCSPSGSRWAGWR